MCWFIKLIHILAIMLYQCGLINYFWSTRRLIILLTALVLFSLRSGTLLNFMAMTLRLKDKSSRDTNAPFFIEPNLLLLPALILCTEVCFPPSVQPLPHRVWASLALLCSSFPMELRKLLDPSSACGCKKCPLSSAATTASCCSY